MANTYIQSYSLNYRAPGETYISRAHLEGYITHFIDLKCTQNIIKTGSVTFKTTKEFEHLVQPNMLLYYDSNISGIVETIDFDLDSGLISVKCNTLNVLLEWYGPVNNFSSNGENDPNGTILDPYSFTNNSWAECPVSYIPTILLRSFNYRGSGSQIGSQLSWVPSPYISPYVATWSDALGSLNGITWECCDWYRTTECTEARIRLEGKTWQNILEICWGMGCFYYVDVNFLPNMSPRGANCITMKVKKITNTQYNFPSLTIRSDIHRVLNRHIVKSSKNKYSWFLAYNDSSSKNICGPTETADNTWTANTVSHYNLVDYNRPELGNAASPQWIPNYDISNKPALIVTAPNGEPTGSNSTYPWSDVRTQNLTEYYAIAGQNVDSYECLIEDVDAPIGTICNIVDTDLSFIKKNQLLESKEYVVIGNNNAGYTVKNIVSLKDLDVVPLPSDPLDAIPVQSSSSHAGVSSSTSISTANYPNWKAFDGNDTTFFAPQVSTATGGVDTDSFYIQYAFDSPKKFSHIRTKLAISNTNLVTDWWREVQFFGTNDDLLAAAPGWEGWTPLTDKTRVSKVHTASKPLITKLVNNHAEEGFKYIRLCIVETYNNVKSIANWQNGQSLMVYTINCLYDPEAPQ